MRPVKSRREAYSEATKAALLEEATKLFAEHGYAETSLEQVATATRVTRGAVYHHFAGKQALFEAVLEAQERLLMERITGMMTTTDPWDAAMLALEVFLDMCCDPAYGRLVWQEGPTALGWHRWRECEEKYVYGFIEGFVRDLIDAGYIESQAMQSRVRYTFWILGGAGLTLADTPDEDKPRIRDEWNDLIRKTLTAFRIK